MVDTTQKRDRNRKQLEKRQFKEARRRDRAEAKHQRGPQAAMSSPGGAFPLDLDAEQQSGQPSSRSEGN